jgi:hypothetical protein
MKQFKRNCWIVGVILSLTWFVCFGLYIQPVLARPGRLNASTTLNQTTVNDITNITNEYFIIDSNDTDDIDITPPGAKNGNGKVKLKTPDGLEIVVASGQDPKIIMKDGDVSHGMTSTFAEASVVGLIESTHSTIGGINIQAGNDLGTNVCLQLLGAFGVTNPDDEIPVVRVVGSKSDGATGITGLGADETVFAATNADTFEMDLKVMGDGDVGIQLDQTTPSSELHVGGATPAITVGDAGEEDSQVNFDGNAQDYHIGVDDTDDELKIGRGTALGTTTAINVTTGDDVEIVDDLILLGAARWATDPNLGDVGATETLDFSANNNYVVLLDQSCTISVTDPGAGISKGTVIFYQTGAGSFTVTWPSNFDWDGDSAPTLSTTSGDYDVLSWVYCGVTGKYRSNAYETITVNFVDVQPALGCERFY